MKPQNLIIIFSGFIAFILGIYISFFEAKEISEDLGSSQKPQVSINENKFIDIGDLRFVLPESWEQENPSNSMRLAQFLLPDKDKNARLVVFSGIGGTIRDNLERWYKQFETENLDGKSNKPILNKEIDRLLRNGHFSVIFIDGS